MKKTTQFLIFIILFIIALILTPFIYVSNILNSKNIEDSVKDLVIELRAIEYVRKVEAVTGGGGGPDIRIDISVEDDFMEESSLEVLDLAKEYFTADVVNEFMAKFERVYPPDTHIYMRNRDGRILFDINGSYYKPMSIRNEPPDYTQYEWR